MFNSKLPLSVVKFAGTPERVKVYEQFKDYYFNYATEVLGQKGYMYDKSCSLAMKNEKVHQAMLQEIQTLANCKIPTANEGIDLVQFASHPTLTWATFAVVNTIIDAIIPDTILKNIGLYTDIKTVPYGQVAQFDIRPNSLMSVSQSSNGKSRGYAQKQFGKSVSLVPVNHEITVEVSMYALLSGAVSLAEFVTKALISMEKDMTVSAYQALSALATDGSFPAELRKGTASVDSAIELCENVTAINNNSNATILGTALAVNKILPSATDGYRISIPGNEIAIDLIKSVLQYPVMRLPQISDGHKGFVLDNKTIYILSTGVDKIIKGVVEGSTMTFAKDFNMTADLTSSVTFNKRYAFEAIGNATMGVIAIGS